MKKLKRKAAKKKMESQWSAMSMFSSDAFSGRYAEGEEPKGETLVEHRINDDQLPTILADFLDLEPFEALKDTPNKWYIAGSSVMCIFDKDFEPNDIDIFVCNGCVDTTRQITEFLEEVGGYTAGVESPITEVEMNGYNVQIINMDEFEEDVPLNDCKDILASFDILPCSLAMGSPDKIMEYIRSDGITAIQCIKGKDLARNNLKGRPFSRLLERALKYHRRGYGRKADNLERYVEFCISACDSQRNSDTKETTASMPY